MANFPAHSGWLFTLLLEAGFVLIPTDVASTDAALTEHVLQNGDAALPVVKRGSNGQPVVSIATGRASLYHVASSDGKREVYVPQCIQLPNTNLSTAVLEQVLASAH